MNIIQVQFAPWDRPYSFNDNNLNLAKGEYVIVKTDQGTEMGKIINIFSEEFLKNKKIKEESENNKKEISDNKNKNIKDEEEPQKSACQNKSCGDCTNCKTSFDTADLKPILRKAIAIDFEKQASEKEKKETMAYCKKIIIENKMPMKVVDVYFSFDGSKITFAFIADGRIDFRDLVKDLTKHFNRTIRLHQIGIRDEAKLIGGYGHCGLQLCCNRFLNNLFSITSEMAENQQVVHRGSDRISGTCGRLMCCLAYENIGYQELAKNLPPIGKRVRVSGKYGVVVGHNILKQSVKVEFPADKENGKTVVEVDVNKK